MGLSEQLIFTDSNEQGRDSLMTSAAKRHGFVQFGNRCRIDDLTGYELLDEGERKGLRDCAEEILTAESEILNETFVWNCDVQGETYGSSEWESELERCRVGMHSLG